MMAPAAFADQIGDAAKKLGDASYDFAKEVDWNNGVFLQAPGRAVGGRIGKSDVCWADDFCFFAKQDSFVTWCIELDTPDYLLGSWPNDEWTRWIYVYIYIYYI